MNCYYHENKPAVTQCTKCGVYLCRDCKNDAVYTLDGKVVCLNCSKPIAENELKEAQKEKVWSLIKFIFSGIFIGIALLAYISGAGLEQVWIVAGIAGLPAAFKASRRSREQRIMDEIHDRYETDIINLTFGWMIRLLVKLAIIIAIAPICAFFSCISNFVVFLKSAKKIRLAEETLEHIEQCLNGINESYPINQTSPENTFLAGTNIGTPFIQPEIPSSTNSNDIQTTFVDATSPVSQNRIFESSQTKTKSTGKNKATIITAILGGLLVAGLIAGYFLWYVPYAKDRDALRTYVIANNLILRSSKVAGVEYNILTQVPYGAELITYSKDDEWAEIKSDGVTGFVASAYLLEWDDFKLLNDVWGNTDAKEYIESTKCRLAILDYCKRNQLQTGSNDWQIYTLQKNVQPNNVSFPRLENGYDKFTEFAFIIKNNSTQERKLAIYSFDVENEAPIFLWDEIAPPNGMIRNITCNEDTYYVIYTGDQIRSISWETRARNNMDRISPPPMPAPIVAETLTIVDNEVELAETDETEAESIKPEKAEQPSDNATNDNTVYDVVEVNPRFPGGETALRSFLSTHIIYPKVCQEQGIQGRVYVQFVVRKDGNISDVKVLRSPDPYLSKEAERVVNLMPKWEPGKQKGKAVSVKYTLPINFMLQ